MERIKKLIKWKLDYLKKIDTFIGKWVMKIPMLMFDFLVVVIVTMPFLWGILTMILQSFTLGLIMMLVGVMIGTYLLVKRHQKLDDFINK